MILDICYNLFKLYIYWFKIINNYKMKIKVWIYNFIKRIYIYISKLRTINKKN